MRKAMAIRSVSSKGQITLPAAARRAVGIRLGDRVQVRVSEGEIIVTPLADFLELEGFLGKGIPRRVERKRAMEAAARRAAGK
jgi:AbrB family looped-hinge helix DNA binding protein